MPPKYKEKDTNKETPKNHKIPHKRMQCVFAIKTKKQKTLKKFPRTRTA